MFKGLVKAHFYQLVEHCLPQHGVLLPFAKPKVAG